jgi:eukaryotic-like serine/threonine-protein kinase
MPSKPLEPGDPVRLGRFELLGRLGEGGQGVVYLGRGTNPGEARVAVKVLRSTVDANVLERLARELDAIHQVQPFVTAGVIEASAEGDRRYVVSEFIDGPSLQERVDDRGPLSEGDLQRLAVGTATALTAIHGAGVVHRDFKPANVLLGPDGPRVVDFGIARLTDAATITSGLIGTPSYVAPEQLAGARPTNAVDIFAWALTMIYAATGRLAFGADSVPAVMHRIMYEEPDVSGLPPSLRTVVLECLDKDPARRPSARDLLLRLVDPSAPRTPAGRPAEELVDSVPQTGSVYPQTGPVYPPAGPTFPGREPTQLSIPGQAPARSRRTLILLAGGAVAAAIVVLAVVLLTRGSPPPSPADSGDNSLAGRASSPAATVSQTTSPPPATGGATIPAAFAGIWKGTATMSPVGSTTISLKNTIRFTFVAGARTAHEDNQECVNTLTLTSATDTTLVFTEPQTANCVAGTATFTRHGTGMAYRWTDNIEQNTATLRKS